MKTHPEGRVIAWGSAAILIFCMLASVVYGSALLRFLSLLLLVWTAFAFYFFRNPYRQVEENSSNIVSPADGKVVVIEKVFEPEYFKEERWQISIFMSPLNVHVNRSPITGEVIHYKYHPGKYLVAWHPKSSTENERNTIILEDSKKRQLLVRQIAGAVARRIVCRLQPGDHLVQGEELGFIKFGSRVDVFLPLDAQILVQPDQLVKGNIDLLAKWANTPDTQKKL
ncbi:phosphatidylserine decarboxylase family protein [Membranicola marinus]|uniref:Phosphatidylserine decarboxylase proenzyme n=1 Tax=Membranihabitans marinus TaxID=1227546 RepID=A0A953HSM1_9BACT|nr:phosphatidylserine decarboxylase family protein [Membranihabitans marinus]MBY5957635.1 phosphatidylserine decarboxylase family protein [Membranihabitans marinus]